MYNRYWRYPIRKGWNCQLTNAQKNHNIFCYGKSDTLKTEKITAEVLQYALECGRNCIVFQKADHPALDTVYKLAKTLGYTFTDLDESAEIVTCENMIEIAREFVHSNKRIIHIHPDQMVSAFYATSAINFLGAVAYIIGDKAEGYESLGTADPTAKPIHVILDGLDKDFAVKLTWLAVRKLIFAVTCSSDFLSESWLQSQIDTYIDTLVDHDAIRACSLNGAARYFNKATQTMDIDFGLLLNLDKNIQEFFAHFQTIACVGADNVSPNVQKEMMGRYLFGRERPINVGGRYIISEAESHAEAAMAKNKIWSGISICGNVSNSGRTPIQINGEQIENNWYGLMSHMLIPQTYVIEVDGRILTYFTEEMHGPVIHFNKGAAEEWLAKYIETQGITAYPVYGQDDAYGYKWRDFEGREHEMRFSIVEITPENAAHIRDNFLVNMLEIEDLESRLDRFEMFYRDKLQSKAMWDRSALCYFPENIEYFKLFTYTQKINEIEKTQEEAARLHKEEIVEVPDEYRWRPYEAMRSSDEEVKAELNIEDKQLGSQLLPQDNVLFMGGHQNMVKKLRQIFPNWTFITDDLFKEGGMQKFDTIFFWSKHASHKLYRYIESRKSDGKKFLYVTATNLKLLIKEMEDAYATQGVA